MDGAQRLALAIMIAVALLLTIGFIRGDDNAGKQPPPTTVR